MHRFYLPPEHWIDGLALQDEEARHAARVLRVRVGEQVEIFDGTGNGALVEILEVTKSRVELRRVADIPDRPGSGVTLVQALPKGKAFDVILQKATELGVEKIVPLVTERTVARREAGDSPEKWRRTLVEACKQCGRNTVPDLDPPREFTEWLVSISAESEDIPRGFGSLETDLNRTPLSAWTASWRAKTPVPSQACVLIGPEGDLSPSECARLRAAGWEALDFGPVVLRSDTAALCALSVTGQELRALARDS